MYRRRIPQSILPTQHNLKTLLENYSRDYFYKYTLMVRQKFMDFRNFKGASNTLQFFIKNGKVYQMLRNTFVNEPRNQSTNLLRVWAHQCECVVAQRLRRCQQMFCMYSNLWEERALKEFMRRMRQTIAKRSKDFMLGSIGISAYNWDKNRIPEEEIYKHLNELEYIYTLKENTICLACDRTKKLEVNSQTTFICECGSSGKLGAGKTYDDWVPFIEKKDLVVWRRLHSSGSYEYKVYGSYNDVSAEDFLNVQVDTDYRRQWDNTAVVLEVAETDPKASSNSDIIYWEMLWPRLFANRDYVFNRRYLVDSASKTIIIYSKSTEHPAFPKNLDKYRIEDYWSCMVIKPYTDMNTPGLEFSLTYFDNPGVNIPSSVTTWVAMRAMPDFLERLREATVGYRQYCKEFGTTKACEIIKMEEEEKDAIVERDKLEYCSFRQKAGFNTTRGRDDSKSRQPEKKGSGNVKKDKDGSGVASTDLPASNTAIKAETNSFWKYLHPTYYFH